MQSSSGTQPSVSECPKTALNLLALPTEVRRCIWENLPEEYGTVTFVGDDGQGNKNRMRWSYSSPKLKLDNPVYVCRMMHDEILPILHRNTQILDLTGWSLSSHMHVPRQIPQAITGSIKQLEIRQHMLTSTLNDELLSLQTIVMVKLIHLPSTSVLLAKRFVRSAARVEFKHLQDSGRLKDGVEVLLRCKIRMPLSMSGVVVDFQQFVSCSYLLI